MIIKYNSSSIWPKYLGCERLSESQAPQYGDRNVEGCAYMVWYTTEALGTTNSSTAWPLCHGITD